MGKKVGGTLEKGWLYKDSLNPVAQTGGQGNVTHRFVYGDKPNVPAYMIKDGTTYRIISDHLGSVRLVVNASTGEVVQRLDYSPFGRVTQNSNPGFDVHGCTNAAGAGMRGSGPAIRVRWWAIRPGY